MRLLDVLLGHYGRVPLALIAALFGSQGFILVGAGLFGALAVPGLGFQVLVVAVGVLELTFARHVLRRARTAARWL